MLSASHIIDQNNIVETSLDIMSKEETSVSDNTVTEQEYGAHSSFMLTKI